MKAEDRIMGGGERVPSVELLRCFLMFLIVFAHCCYYGVFRWTECKWLVVLILLVRFHVDSFVAISGWFGIRFSWSKVVRMIGIFLFYSILSMVFNPIETDLRSFRVSGGWFGGTYLMLMFLTPLINAGIEFLAERSIHRVWSAWGIFAVGMILNWLPYRGFTGCDPSGGGSHSLLTLLFVYVTARVLSISNNRDIERRFMLSAVLVFTAVILFGTTLMAIRQSFQHIHLNWGNVKWITDYNSPGVWMLAVAILVFFARRVRLSNLSGRIVKFLSPSMFGVYLFHETTSFGHEIFRIPQTWLLQHTSLSMCTVLFMTAIFTYVVGIIVDLSRRMFLLPFKNYLKKLFRLMDMKWGNLS